MSVAFNSGPSAAPLARMIAAFVASRAGRPPSASSRDGRGGIRDRGIRAAAMSSLPYGLWRDRGGTLDITSARNPKVKLMRSFHKRRTRDDGGKILAEGHRLVCDLIEGGLTPTLVIALRASPGPRLQAALETLSADVVAVAPAEVVQRCCDTVTSQGVVALVERPVLPLPPTMQTVLICDGIQDPGNLGTLVRTAAGLGADAVVLTGSCVDYWAPKTVRASMGASFRLPSLRLESWQEVVELMRARGIRMYAADGGARLSHFDADWTSPSALVVGAEARGLSDAARLELESGGIAGVSVPLEGGVESLNAAVAGAIVLGEAQRQRLVAERHVGVRWGGGMTGDGELSGAVSQ
ncbi:unnamed protein product [Ectocarpus sp. CCAP 1310/34]|nr:unnamed protein product [Ectocarpus sp. CCAP 1310/34]